jgi:signal transduction histidine kinase
MVVEAGHGWSGSEGGASPPVTEAERLEHALQSLALPWLASGLAHDVKNPLNAMALHLAVLADKLEEAGDAVAAIGAVHLASLREQIGRIDDAVRRFAESADPSPRAEPTDVSRVVADLCRLLAHEARRRRVELRCEAGPEAVRSRCHPARLGRLLLGLFRRALAETPPGGRLVVCSAAEGPDATVRFEGVAGPEAPDLAFVTDIVAASAAAMGGRLAVHAGADGTRYVLALPRSGAP